MAKKSVFHCIKPMDIIVIIVSIGIVIILFILSLSYKSDVLYVEIKTDKDLFIYPLVEPRDIVLYGPLGDTFVSIEDEQVRVIDSPGRQKICVKSGPIANIGQWLACLPNKVFLRILGDSAEETGIDAVSF